MIGTFNLRMPFCITNDDDDEKVHLDMYKMKTLPLSVRLDFFSNSMGFSTVSSIDRVVHEEALYM